MALVDYTSDASDEEAEGPPPKKSKTTPSSIINVPPGAPSTSLPPLPASFHDLYASTVRTSNADDPALHQGRRRQNPHVAGHWPSHLYVEWHPPSAEHALLEGLVRDLQARRAGPDPTAGITDFLVSDVGVPLPLHISLSRPIVLTTADKDAFLGDVAAAARRSGVAPFVLRCEGVEWHRTEESRRSFLVLRVQSTQAGAQVNPEMRELLRRCNGVVKSYGQPELYQWASDDRDPGKDGAVAKDKPEQERAKGRVDIGQAFHISIAWSFAEVTEELKEVTREVFGDSSSQESLREIHIEVGGLKAKIGNVVTHIPLPERGRRGSDQRPGGLLGLG